MTHVLHSLAKLHSQLKLSAHCSHAVGVGCRMAWKDERRKGCFQTLQRRQGSVRGTVAAAGICTPLIGASTLSWHSVAYLTAVCCFSRFSLRFGSESEISSQIFCLAFVLYIIIQSYRRACQSDRPFSFRGGAGSRTFFSPVISSSLIFTSTTWPFRPRTARVGFISS